MSYAWALTAQDRSQDSAVLSICRLIQLAGDRLKYLFSLSEYYIEKDECESAVGQRFPALLLDLANYYDDELIQESLHLLNRFYSAEITLFQKAIQTELIHTEESHTVLSQVIHMELPTIRRLVRCDCVIWCSGEVVCLVMV